ncbi:hypothetical protein NPIL_131011 [Nephila pilipes]|uniref:Uncharacterized protein n=1 Tax=Nephila pilipes TaxID=299642 RepID=A0A8X6U715_NEPPI|nr:hypothetical protein NPIL_131011 [Nephila pilipes]
MPSSLAGIRGGSEKLVRGGMNTIVQSWRNPGQFSPLLRSCEFELQISLAFFYETHTKRLAYATLLNSDLRLGLYNANLGNLTSFCFQPENTAYN